MSDFTPKHIAEALSPRSRRELAKHERRAELEHQLQRLEAWIDLLSRKVASSGYLQVTGFQWALNALMPRASATTMVDLESLRNVAAAAWRLTVFCGDHHGFADSPPFKNCGRCQACVANQRLLASWTYSFSPSWDTCKSCESSGCTGPRVTDTVASANGDQRVVRCQRCNRTWSEGGAS